MKQLRLIIPAGLAALLHGSPLLAGHGGDVSPGHSRGHQQAPTMETVVVSTVQAQSRQYSDNVKF